MGSDAVALGGALDRRALAGGRSSFAFSFSFLPRRQREALRTVYAFCRTTDDIVDNDADVTTKLQRLQGWRRELERSIEGRSDYPMLNQLAGVAAKFNIPVVHFFELVRGVEMDLVKNRYATFNELEEYCYHVASSVGLMCLGVFGARDERTKDYAVNLGIALQLTNILRDVGIDASYGRIYLPQEDIVRLGCSEADILGRSSSPAFVRLMEFEAARAESYFARAQQALPRTERRAMFAATIMERIYVHTLRRIRAAGYDVFGQDLHLPRYLQFLIAIKYWVKDRILSA
jgi:phytoene synthase